MPKRHGLKFHMLWKLWRQCWYYIIRTWYVGVRLDRGEGILLSSFSLTELRQLGLVEDCLASTKYLPPERLWSLGFLFTLREFLGAGHRLEKLIDMFDAVDLLREGFSPAELRKAGLRADKLKGCCTIHELKDAGYSPQQLKSAGYWASSICLHGFHSKFSASELKEAGFEAADMKAGNWPARELLEAGYKLRDLLKVYSLRQLREGGITASQLQFLGCEAGELLAGGYPIIQIWTAGYTISQMREAGVRSRQLVDTINASKYALLLAGFKVSEISSPEVLLDNRGM